MNILEYKTVEFLKSFSLTDSCKSKEIWHIGGITAWQITIISGIGTGLSLIFFILLLVGILNVILVSPVNRISLYQSQSMSYKIYILILLVSFIQPSHGYHISNYLTHRLSLFFPKNGNQVSVIGKGTLILHYWDKDKYLVFLID